MYRKCLLTLFSTKRSLGEIYLLIESARRTTKIPMFYTTIEMLALKYESSAWLYTYNKLFAIMQQQQRSMSEKRDQSLAINRKEEEMVITKHTASIFIGTDFERMIRNAGIITIIFSGIATGLGVESSERDALNRILSCYSFRYSVIIR